MFDSLKKVFNLNIFSFLFGLIGVVLAIYFYYLGNKKDFFITLENKINLINVNESLNNLDMIYKGKSVYEDNLSLQLLTIKFENLGNNITEFDFSKNSEFAIEIIDAEIVELREVKTSSKFIKNSLLPKIVENKIILNKIMIDKSDYFDINFIVLKKVDKNMKINILGKISGIDELIIKEEKSSNNFFELINFINNHYIIAFLAFLIVSFIVGVLIIIALIYITEGIKKIKRGIKNKPYKKYFGVINSLEDSPSMYWSDELLKQLVRLIRKNEDRDKSEIIRHFLKICFTNDYAITKLIQFKTEYEENIHKLLPFVNKHWLHKKEEILLKNRISKIEEKIQITDSVSLYDIKGQSKYILFKDLLTKELIEVQNLYEHNQENLSRLQKTIEAFDTNIKITYLEYLINKSIIFREKNGEIIEDKVFINEINNILTYFKSHLKKELKDEDTRKETKKIEMKEVRKKIDDINTLDKQKKIA